MLAGTFERRWQRIAARQVPGNAWSEYTPYEVRNVGAFVRLGWRARANAALDAYLTGRRPAGWNGWAEVVGHDPRQIRFMGDMPHAWVASNFIRAALDMFAYVRADTSAIVLGAGMDASWLDGDGVRLTGLHTQFGVVDLAMKASPGRLTVTIAGGARPPGGFVLPWPLDGHPGIATINGKSAVFDSDGLHTSLETDVTYIAVEHRHPD